ncbi:MAG: DUF1361 domain-containing protein [Cyanobacteria bacterium P01_D01_bin.1]
MNDWIVSSIAAAQRSTGFMAWNTFLAVVPMVASLWLFRRPRAARRRLDWWVGLIVFVAFLPNAPYVLTDIIHFIRFIREGATLGTVVFVLVPQYLIFMLIGIEAYTISLINMGHYLRQQGWRNQVSAAELLLHALCAIGIYLGRFPRFNSWDLITDPINLLRYVAQMVRQPQSLAVIVLTFGVIAMLYWPLKHISLALALYWRYIPVQQDTNN